MHFKILVLLIIVSVCLASPIEKKQNWSTSIFERFADFITGRKRVKGNFTPEPAAPIAPLPTGTPQAVDANTLQIVAQHVQKAKQLISTSDIKDAAEVLLTALELHPDSLEANSMAGSCFLLLKRPDFAEGFLYSAVALSEWKDPVSIANLAESLRLNGDVNLAVQVAMKGYESMGRKDESGLVEYVLGACYLAQQKYSIASEWFLSAALHQPSNAEAWIYASTMKFPEHGGHRDYKFAENVLVQGMQENPQSIELVFQMGMVMFHTSRLQQAIKCFDFVIGKNPEHKYAHAMLATALHAVGGHAAEALNAYNEALKHNSDNAMLHANFGLLLHSEFVPQGTVNTEDIVRLADRALQLDPSIQDAVNLVNTYRKPV